MTAKGKTPLIWPLLDKLNPAVARQQRPKSNPLGIERLPTAPWDQSDHPKISYGQVEGTPTLWEQAPWNLGQAKLGRQSVVLQNFKTNPRALRVAEQWREPSVVHPVRLSLLGPISSSASITEADDAVAATSTVLVSPSASITEAADTVSAISAVLVSSSASITEFADTVAGTSTVLVSPSASITEAADTVAATDTVLVSATASITEAVDTVAATFTVLVQTAASITEAADTISGSASNTVSLTASIAETDDALSGTATVSVGASVVITDAGDTASSAVGILVQASASLTEGDDTQQVDVLASLNVTEADDTLTASVPSEAGVGNGVTRPNYVPPPLRLVVPDAPVVDYAPAQARIVELLRALPGPSPVGSVVVTPVAPGITSRPVLVTANDPVEDDTNIRMLLLLAA